MSLSKNKAANAARERKEKEKHLMVVLEKLQEETVRKHNWGLQLKRKAQALQQELNNISNHLEQEVSDVGILARLISAKKLELSALQNTPPLMVTAEDSNQVVAELPPAQAVEAIPAVNTAVVLSSPRSARKRKVATKQVEILPELIQIKKKLKQKQQDQLRKMTARVQRRKETQLKALPEPGPETLDPKKNMLMLNQKMKNLLSTRMIHLQALIAKKGNKRSSLQRVVVERKLEKLPDQRYRPKKMKPILFEEGVVVMPVSPESLDAIGLLFWSLLGSLAVAEWPVGSRTEAKTESFESTVEFIDRTTNSKPYCSPLGRLGVRAYRLSEQFLNVFSSLSSLTLSNNIDPKVLFCRYDIQGRCNDDACDWQHMRSVGLRSEQLSQDLAALLGTESSVKVAAACIQDEAAWRKEGKVSRVRMRASKSPSVPTVSDAAKVSTVDICLPKMNKVEDARAEFEALVQAEPESAQHWLTYSKLYKDHEQLGERLKILARAIEVNNHNDVLWGEYLRVYAQQARSIDMEQMLAHATTYCSSALHLWVSSARYRTRLQKALAVCKEGVDEQVASLLTSPLSCSPVPAPSQTSEAATAIVLSQGSNPTFRAPPAMLASFNIRGLLTLAATLCCDAGRSGRGKLLLEDWFEGRYTKQDSSIQLATQLELVDQLGLWLTYIFIVAFDRVPLFTDPFSGLFGSQLWRYGRKTKEWSQMVVAAIRKALGWFERYAGDIEAVRQQSHKCTSVLRAHLIAVEQLNALGSCVVCREMFNDSHLTPQLYLLCAAPCLCFPSAMTVRWESFSSNDLTTKVSTAASFILHGVAVITKFPDNSSVWLKFAQVLVEARRINTAAQLLVLFCCRLNNPFEVVDDVLTVISNQDRPNVELAETNWANFADKNSLPVDAWRCYCLLMSLVKSSDDAQRIYEESLNDCTAADRDWLWLDLVGHLKNQSSKMLLAVDRFVSELLRRSEVRNYTRNQEAEFGAELEHIGAIAPYVICNRIVHLYLAQEQNVHRVSAVYETVCRLLPNNVLLGLSWARYEIECRSARLARAQQHLYHMAIMFPRIPAVFQCLAQIMLSTGRLELARKYLRSGLEHNPLAASLISDLVQLESTYGELSAAQSLATDALQRGSKIQPPVSRPTEILN